MKYHENSYEEFHKGSKTPRVLYIYSWGSLYVYQQRKRRVNYRTIRQIYKQYRVKELEVE